MILPLLFNPALWRHVGHHHAKAMMTPVGFEMLDNVPQAKQVPATSTAIEEDAMAVQKSAA